MDGAVRRRAESVLEDEAADESVRAVLITGAGRGFSSGADLKAGFEPAEDGMPDIRTELRELYHPAIAGVRRLPKPVVAAVNGPAVGIGCSLALACDLVMAAESAFFGLAFVNIGLMPDGGSTAFVPPAVGKARAFQMALLGERSPPRRRSNGAWSTRSYPDDRLMDEADALVERLAAGPPAPTPARSEALNRIIYGDLDAPARPRGRAPARAWAEQGLHRGRCRFRREARPGLHRLLADRPRPKRLEHQDSEALFSFVGFASAFASDFARLGCDAGPRRRRAGPGRGRQHLVGLQKPPDRLAARRGSGLDQLVDHGARRRDPDVELAGT